MKDRRFHEEAARLLADVCANGVATRLWAQDVSLWMPAATPADAEAIRHRLGWLRAPHELRAQIASFAAFAHEIRREGVRSAILLGMGGSSLGTVVLREALGVAADGVNVEVVDTTDDFTVHALLDRIDPRHTVVLVVSKSGTTVEVDALARLLDEHFRRFLPEREVCRRFVAITDRGTPLDQLAATRGYRRVFHTPADVGGRFSVLSPVGLVPAALMGQRLDQLVDRAAEMAAACRVDESSNPGLALAAFLATGARTGRDKLTLLFSRPLGSLGCWVEQLVAESTGKHGRGLLPVVDEPWDLDCYGPDRLFIVVRSPGDEELERLALHLAARGEPVFSLTSSADSLGGEFFRWQFAVAALGALLELNPFDEPDVQAAKARTAALLAAYERSGILPDERPVLEAEGVAAVSPLAERVGARSPVDLVRAALASVGPGDYVAWLSYLSPDPVSLKALAQVRHRVGRHARAASVIGVGPRYLHSTGQYYKGGPNRGLFFLLTADDRTETPVPGRPYSFAVLKRAQAVGDYQALVARGRRVVRLHFPAEPAAQADALMGLFVEALGSSDRRTSA